MRTRSFPILLAASAAAVDTNITLTVPNAQPSFAQPLSSTLAGFSIEMDRWPDWAGQNIGSPNKFVNQVLTNLAGGTGRPPSIRVGADSEDRAFIAPDVQVINATFPPPTATIPVPEASYIGIGRDFYALSANFPSGTAFNWGINLAALNLSETIAQGRLLADTFQGSRKDLLANVSLRNVEIGNEPDYYKRQHPETVNGNWDPTNYTSYWVPAAKALTSIFDFGLHADEGTTLWAGSFATFADDIVWNAKAALEAGILTQDRTAARYTKTWVEHHYYGVFGGQITPVGSLMDKTSVRHNMSQKISSIDAAHSAGMTYVLGETNSFANHGVPGVSNTAEAAIWGIDHLLYSASIGVDSLHFHNGVGYRYNVIQPIAGADDGTNTTSRPHILPLYHAFLVVNEAIGRTSDSFVAELQTANTTLTAYGIWEYGMLRRVVILNSNVYIPGSATTVRSSFNVKFSNWSAGNYATVKRLYTPATTASHGLTWGDQNFDTVSGVPQGKMATETVTTGVVNVPASQAVLVTFADRPTSLGCGI